MQQMIHFEFSIWIGAALPARSGIDFTTAQGCLQGLDRVYVFDGGSGLRRASSR